MLYSRELPTWEKGLKTLQKQSCSPRVRVIKKTKNTRPYQRRQLQRHSTRFFYLSFYGSPGFPICGDWEGEEQRYQAWDLMKDYTTRTVSRSFLRLQFKIGEKKSASCDSMPQSIQRSMHWTKIFATTTTLHSVSPGSLPLWLCSTRNMHLLIGYYCRGAWLPSSLCWSLDTVWYSWQADTVGGKSGVVNLYGRTVLLLYIPVTPCIPVIE